MKMNMIFNRSKVQIELEKIINCPKKEELKQFKKDFLEIQITHSNRATLIDLLKEDSKGTFFKGVYSLCEAINNIFSGRYSWAVVKLYYSSFYLMKTFLATKNCAFVKCDGFYVLELNVGCKPNIINGRGGEHPKTINEYVKRMENIDRLLSNKIDGEDKSIYDYLRDMREIVNYRDVSFSEPENKYFLGVKKENIKEYIEDDTLVFCTQSPHCLLAAPLQLAKTVNSELSTFLGCEDILTNEQYQAIRKLLEPFDLFDLLHGKGYL